MAVNSITWRQLFIAVALLAATGCTYKIEIQQGNNTLLEKAGELEVGMSQEAVVRLLGSPPTTRLFRKNIWIYTYQRRASGFIGKTRRRVVELIFDDDGVLQEINTLQDDYADTSADTNTDTDDDS